MSWLEKLGAWAGAQLTRPLTELRQEIALLREEDRAQTGKLDALDADLADVLCSALTREHDLYLERGWCPAADKRRLDAMYARYRARGRNHVAGRYMEDLLSLPEEPAREERSGT